jgi:hypothetical protein
LVRKPQGNNRLEKLGVNGNVIFTKGIHKIGVRGLIHLVQNRAAFVDTVMNLTQNVKNFFTNLNIFSLSK